jgi:type VI protein secretion system component VasF
MWQRVIDRKARSQRIRERIVTWAVIGCLVVVAVRLFYVATA